MLALAASPLDHNAAVFLSMNDVPIGGDGGMIRTADGRRVEFSATGELPCFLHANGNGKTAPRLEIFIDIAQSCFEARPEFSVPHSRLRIISL